MAVRGGVQLGAASGTSMWLFCPLGSSQSRLSFKKKLISVQTQAEAAFEVFEHRAETDP